MATTIKTQLLQGLVTALQGAANLRTVERFPPIPTNLDAAKAPIAYIHESTPEIRETNNRFYRGVLELDIMVFIELQSRDAETGNLIFLDKADEIQGEIHGILMGTGTMSLAGGPRILERSVEKIIPNDSWGVLLYTVEVTYQHLTGDAFSSS